MTDAARAERIAKLLAFHEAAPGDDFAPYAIAQEHAAAGDTDEALAWIERTLAVNPDHAYAYFQRARLIAEAGDLEAARSAVADGIAAARRSSDAKAEAELRELLETI